MDDWEPDDPLDPRLKFLLLGQSRAGKTTLRHLLSIYSDPTFQYKDSLPGTISDGYGVGGLKESFRY
jgi:hypothetical protein